MAKYYIFILLLLATLSLSAQNPARIGKDQAVFFYVANYQYGWERLPETKTEVEALADELKNNYGFAVEIVPNPTKAQIEAKISEVNQRRLGKDDQLLLFFSMHGHFDLNADRGYLVPTDGKLPDRDPDAWRSWLSYDDLSAFLARNECGHILLALDACYSGAFGDRWKGAPAALPWEDTGMDCRQRVAQALAPASRMYFSSGSREQRTPARSKFANRWLEALARGRETGLVRINELRYYLNSIDFPQPEGGTFTKRHQPGGDFVFLHKNACGSAPPPDRTADRAAWQAAAQANTLVAYRKYRADFPNGEFIPLAAERIARLETAEREERDWDEAKRLNTRKAYEDFIGQYPNSDYLNLAELYRDRLKAPEPVRPTTPIGRLEADMVRVAAGSFTMGCQSAARDGECYDDEKPPREVQVPAFSIGKYEVTQAQWRAVMGSDPSNNKGCDECPVEQVSWNDIQEFLRKLNAQTGKRYRLPTEAEWEYAARGGAQSRGYLYSGSNTIDEVAWYSSNSGGKTRPVGGKKPNELGLYDMSGNVWEWCEDDWHSNYDGAPTDGRAWVDNDRGTDRLRRGGSWHRDPPHCRAIIRGSNALTNRYKDVGFRLAHSAE